MELLDNTSFNYTGVNAQKGDKMDRVEEVRKGIEKALIGYGSDVLRINKAHPIGKDSEHHRFRAFNLAREKRLNQICQLFEPKPDRLLTYADLKLYGIGEISGDITNLLKAQDVKTYPIAFEEGHRVGIAKCQARVERIKMEMERLFPYSTLEANGQEDMDIKKEYKV